MDKQVICDYVKEIVRFDGSVDVKRITYEPSLKAVLIEYRNNNIDEVNVDGLDGIKTAAKILSLIKK